jgi:hypothetical protein
MTASEREIGGKTWMETVKILLTINQLFATKGQSQRPKKAFPMKTTILLKPAARPALKLVVLASVTAMTLLITSQNAGAASQIFNFTFTGNDGIDASGTVTIDTVANVATSGSINVTGVPLEADPNTTTTASGYLLTAGGDVRNFDGDVVTYDTVAYAPPANPIFDNTGVAFGSSIINGNSVNVPAAYDGGTPVYDTIINLWGNGPGSYTMFIGEANPADLNPDGTLIAGRDAQWVYVYGESGTLTTTPVPEPTTYALILCALTVGFVSIRRRRATA